MKELVLALVIVATLGIVIMCGAVIFTVVATTRPKPNPNAQPITAEELAESQRKNDEANAARAERMAKAEAERKRPQCNLGNFYRVEVGMTHAEVIDILGEPESLAAYSASLFPLFSRLLSHRPIAVTYS